MVGCRHYCRCASFDYLRFDHLRFDHCCFNLIAACLSFFGHLTLTLGASLHLMMMIWFLVLTCGHCSYWLSGVGADGFPDYDHKKKTVGWIPYRRNVFLRALLGMSHPLIWTRN